ncbi:unnamed protein product [Tuber aestivum]|uniref:Uncharacterized protein n=1 Tax=Tuber aestivum TaxID=59557 RepID=A0A292Q7R5_9PEZI|nr:unnamed protein product [Tuber aestivum]
MSVSKDRAKDPEFRLGRESTCPSQPSASSRGELSGAENAGRVKESKKGLNGLGKTINCEAQEVCGGAGGGRQERECVSGKHEYLRHPEFETGKWDWQIRSRPGGKGSGGERVKKIIKNKDTG